MSLPYKLIVVIIPAALLCNGCSNSWGTFWKTDETQGKGQSSLRLYATTQRASGNLGGVTGADTTCNTDANKPGAGTWKAVVVQPGARLACSTTDYCTSTSENTNWVLYPNKTYVQSDGTTRVGTTNAGGVFTLPLEAPFTTLPERIWMGFRMTPVGWVAGSSASGGAGENCVNWSSGLGTDFASTGLGNDTGAAALSTGTYNCGIVTYRILCAEQ